VDDMAVHDNEKKNRVARDFRRVLIVLVIIFIAINPLIVKTHLVV
jgi:hypothetical protein